jgi:hypothetical protein
LLTKPSTAASSYEGFCFLTDKFNNIRVGIKKRKLMIVQVFDQEFSIGPGPLIRSENSIIFNKIILGNRLPVIGSKTFFGYFQLGFTIF